jgi:ribosome-binding factor A
MKPIKKDTNRIAKVNSLIQKELGPVLHEFLDWQKGLVTIAKVETSKDMKWAKIWISILHPDPITHPGKTKVPNDIPAMDKKILDFLANNIYDIQGEVNKHFHTKIIPRISFHLDVSPRYVEHIDELIREVHEEQQ